MAMGVWGEIIGAAITGLTAIETSKIQADVQTDIAAQQARLQQSQFTMAQQAAEAQAVASQQRQAQTISTLTKAGIGVGAALLIGIVAYAIIKKKR